MGREEFVKQKSMTDKIVEQDREITELHKELACPHCKGKSQFDLIIKHKTNVPDTIIDKPFPCPNCTDGTLKSYYEKKIAELQAKTVESEKICEEIVLEDNAEELKHKETILCLQKEIANWSLKAIELQAENDRLKKAINNSDWTGLEEWRTYLEQGGAIGKEMRNMFGISLYAIRKLFSIKKSLASPDKGEAKGE